MSGDEQKRYLEALGQKTQSEQDKAKIERMGRVYAGRTTRRESQAAYASDTTSSSEPSSKVCRHTLQ